MTLKDTFRQLEAHGRYVRKTARMVPSGMLSGSANRAVRRSEFRARTCLFVRAPSRCLKKKSYPKYDDRLR